MSLSLIREDIVANAGSWRQDDREPTGLIVSFIRWPPSTCSGSFLPPLEL